MLFDIKHKPPKKSHDERKRKTNAKPHTFSMEPQLYKKFMHDCKERQVNASALIRRLIYMQLFDWATGRNDVEFLMNVQLKKEEQDRNENQD